MQGRENPRTAVDPPIAGPALLFSRPWPRPACQTHHRSIIIVNPCNLLALQPCLVARERHEPQLFNKGFHSLVGHHQTERRLMRGTNSLAIGVLHYHRTSGYINLGSSAMQPRHHPASLPCPASISHPSPESLTTRFRQGRHLRCVLPDCPIHDKFERPRKEADHFGLPFRQLMATRSAAFGASGCFNCAKRKLARDDGASLCHRDFCG